MTQITWQHLQQRINNGEAFTLLDVREPVERAAFHIGGLHIPLSELNQQKVLLPNEGKLVVYCKRGIRSQIAIQRLANSFPAIDFYNLQDGILPLKPS